jgi:hypothetical protein
MLGLLATRIRVDELRPVTRSKGQRPTLQSSHRAIPSKSKGGGDS